MFQGPADLTASQALASLRAGALTAEALAHACLDRIASREGEVRAWAFVDPDRVLEQARALDRSPERRALHGLPLGVKDVILTRDAPTRYNSAAYDSLKIAPDAACVRLLRSAGALMLGKTATVEFGAIGRPPATRNPRDLARTPGGSSSGSAAAVAAAQVPLALGTQTGGSIVRPASFCGVWALKPTWGLVSTEGCRRFAPSLDTVGWFARSVDDLALLLDVFDPPPTPLPPLDAASLRIAVCRTPMWAAAGDPTRAALSEVATRYRAAGAEVVDLDLPESFHRLADLHLLVMRAEGRVSFLDELRCGGAALAPRMREMVERAGAPSGRELVQAWDTAAEARRAFDDLAASFDAVVCPSAPAEAPLGLENTGSLVFNGIWTLLHTPCVNAPAWRSSGGLPVGLTFTGPRFTDRRVLAAAKALPAAPLAP